MNAREILQQATALLADAGCDSPRLDAELLLMHAWQIDKTTLIIRMLDAIPEAVLETFWGLLSRRQQREPVAYITGEKEFWSRPFLVDSRVLIPRPETEHLIEEIVRYYPDRNRHYRFCDIGTGSGCIACTLACEYPHAEIMATDISRAALEVAQTNAARLQVADRITFNQGSMFRALDPQTAKFDAIVSNPPYISKAEMETLEAELDYEPRGALTDEHDGHALLAILLNECGNWLKEGGHLMVETGICGLPPLPSHLHLVSEYDDLAGIKRGGVYRLESTRP